MPVNQGFIITWLILGMFLLIAGFLSQIFMALAVYHDAKARGNTNPAMWGVLTGFFSWIPAIIYLCTRNSNRNKMLPCHSCGFFLPMSQPQCPNCGNHNPYSQQFYGPEVEKAKKNAKGFLIALICVYALIVVLFITLIITLVIGVGDSGLIDDYYYYYR